MSAKHPPANGSYRIAYSCVLRGPVGYDRVAVADRKPGDRILTVVEDSDGRGPAYGHYFDGMGGCDAALEGLALEFARLPRL